MLAKNYGVLEFAGRGQWTVPHTENYIQMYTLLASFLKFLAEPKPQSPYGS
jgi:hypothetical protein